MKTLLTSFAAIFILISTIYAAPVTFQVDNGTPAGAYNSKTTWEETIMLQPPGPCKILKIMVYFKGAQAYQKDTLYIVGDPAEGAYPPSEFVFAYNTLIPPIPFDYSGTEGWYEFDVSSQNLRSDGLDRIVVMHIIRKNGPAYAYDNDGRSTMSILCDALTPNPDFLYIRGTIFSAAGGDFMVRMLVEYDFPKGSGSAPPPPPTLVDVSQEAGLTVSGNVIKAALVSAADWNNDGYDDIAIGSNFFENNKDGTFSNVSSRINVGNGGSVWGDVNNDGYLDVFAIDSYQSMDLLYYGSAAGTFEDNTDAVISLDAPTVSPMWLDYDHDGLLDLFIAYGRTSSGTTETYYPDKLFHNLGNGLFQDVTINSRVSLGEPAPYYDCWGASICDYNNDNYSDVFVATYRLAPDRLYKNNQNGTFDEVSAQTGVIGMPTQEPTLFGHGMGSDWGDFNNDGYDDLAVGNLGHPDERGSWSNPSLIFRNDGPPDYHFTIVSRDMGLKFFEMNAGIVWADLDLDGYLDLVHCQYSYDAKGAGADRFSRFYINEGPTKNYHLKDNTWLFGSLVHGAWSPIRLDYDGDGDMDILIASDKENIKLYRNDLPRKGNWISFRLVGSPANNVPMDAYGSTVKVYPEAGSNEFFMRKLPGSVLSARASQCSNELNFGLGNIDNIDKVVITYPNGAENTINDIALNARYVIPYMQPPQQKMLAKPVQMSPADYAIKVNPTGLFKWYKCGGAETYTAQISDKKDFSNIVEELKTTGNNEATNIIALNQQQTYYWRVKAESQSMQSRWSLTWSFTVGIPLPSKPQLIAPANDLTNVSPKTQLSWTSSTYTCENSGNTLYQVQLATDEDITENLIELKDIDDIGYKFETPLASGTHFYWKVRGTNEGEPGEWSETGNFTTMAMPTAVTLVKPTNGEQDVSIRPTFEWTESQNVINYHLQIASDDQFTNIAYESDEISIPSRRVFAGLTYATKYYWHVRATNDGGASEWSPIWEFTTVENTGVIENETIADDFVLYDNYPNPFSHITTIKFYIPRKETIRLTLFDYLGNELIILVNKELTPGEYSYVLDSGKLPNGTYMYRLNAGCFSTSKKMVLMR